MNETFPNMTQQASIKTSNSVSGETFCPNTNLLWRKKNVEYNALSYKKVSKQVFFKQAYK